MLEDMVEEYLDGYEIQPVTYLPWQLFVARDSQWERCWTTPHALMVVASSLEQLGRRWSGDPAIAEQAYADFQQLFC